jgi:hypothetical protein
VDHASHGGKAIVAGISHSLGKTSIAINQLRHTAENRVSLPGANTIPGLSCVVWITGKGKPALFVLGDGLVRTFPPKSRRSSGGERIRALRLTRYRDFKLYGLPDDTIAPSVQHFIDPEEYLDLSDKDLDAGNTMILDKRARSPQCDFSAESSIPQAEIESSAPYQPFHTDRRVGLYEYVQPQTGRTAEPLPLVSTLHEAASLDDRPLATSTSRRKLKQAPRQADISISVAEANTATAGVWAFGGPIDAVKLDLGLPQLPEEESFNIATDDSRALPQSAMERVLQRVGENDVQIVVTTRRRRGAGRPANADEDGFFEDDCEVLDFADQRV